MSESTSSPTRTAASGTMNADLTERPWSNWYNNKIDKRRKSTKKRHLRYNKKCKSKSQKFGPQYSREEYHEMVEDTFSKCNATSVVDRNAIFRYLPKLLPTNWAARGRKCRTIFGPQIGLQQIMSVIPCLTQLCKIANIDLNDTLLREVEGLATLCYTLMHCDSQIAMCGSIFLYVRSHFSTSISGKVIEYLQEIFEQFTCQDGSEDDDKKEDSSFLSLMKDVQLNWSKAVNAKIFDQFSKVLGLIVVAGLCDASSLTFSIKDVKIWEPNLKIIHSGAIDLIDAALNTSVFFIETISLCLEEKSLQPLLAADKTAADLDEEFSKIILWWDLVKNGNLERVAGINDHEFDDRLEALTTKIRGLMECKGSFERKLFTDKFHKLLSIKNDFITSKISSGVRKSPFCLEFVGESSQGKTTCSEQIIEALLRSASLPTGKEYQAMFNPGDRYMSNWKTKMLVLGLDDFANEKSNFVEKPPTRIIIDVNNNQPFYAVVADLDGKGKIFVEPEILFVTTNVKELDAFLYSNCPYSVQRRMNVVITVKAKKEFQHIIDGQPQGIDPEKVDAHYEKLGEKPAFDDIWELTLERAVKPTKLSAIATYEALDDANGKPMIDISFRDALNYLIPLYDKHRKSQQKIIDRMRYRQSTAVTLCGVEGCKQISGLCNTHCRPTTNVGGTPIDWGSSDDKMDKQFGVELARACKKGMGIVRNRLYGDMDGFSSFAESMSSAALVASARMFSHYWDWMYLVPTPWMANKHVRNMLCCLNAEQIRKNYFMRTGVMWGLLTLGTIGAIRHKAPPKLMLGLAGITGLTVQKHMFQITKDNFENELLARNTIAPALKKIRDKHVGRICAACGIVGALYAVARVYKCWNTTDPQGTLEPATVEEVEKRDSCSNVWSSVTQRKLDVSAKSLTTSQSQLDHIVRKNLLYGSVTIGGDVYRVNGLMLTSNVVAIPAHYFKQDTIEVTFRKCNPDDNGGKFTCKLDKKLAYFPADSDMAYAYVPSGGSFKNICAYFPKDVLSHGQFGLCWRLIDGTMQESGGLFSQAEVDNGTKCFPCYKYDTFGVNTFNGLCGAVMTLKNKSVICGIHVAGISGTPNGCSSIMTQSEISTALEYLRQQPTVTLSGSASGFDSKVLGKEILTNQPIHPKSPLNFLPHGSQVAYHGSCPGASTFKSTATKTIISDSIAEVCGVENIYRGPTESPQWKGWQDCLANMSSPAKCFDPQLLIKAATDYERELLPIFQSKLWNGTKPLTDSENMNGIPGCKFVDAINMSTSIGYPLTGSKLKYLESEEVGNRVFDKEIRDEIDRCMECYKRGERANTVAKACKKDEVLSKDKCRIFYGNPIALTFLIRKYFLGIIRVLQMNPLVAECAVGINSHGPEWQELHDHVLKFGKDRILGGDYGKYDQKLSSQLLLTAFRILIDCAKQCDYSDEDIRIMEAMTGDVVYALIAFNGDLVGLTQGTHISGNSLTVILNGICGSLNLRCCFFANNDDSLKFRECVALSTYGDDNIGSVRPGVNFNIKMVSEFLAKTGQVYTMPDKESELVDFLPAEDFEFLKRESKYIPELGCHVGALAEKSCFKMLHCTLRDSSREDLPTPELASAKNMETALCEWFNHGREVFNMRQVQMVDIAVKHNLQTLCPDIYRTFDQRVAVWKDNYQS